MYYFSCFNTNSLLKSSTKQLISITLFPSIHLIAMKYFFLFLLLFLGKYSVCAQHMISKQLPFFYQLSSNEFLISIRIKKDICG